MKSVIISIQPQWCELIASGKKTIEVRKSAPKEVPFKAYIYQTKKRVTFKTFKEDYLNGITHNAKLLRAHGKVIGEFICDRVYDLFPWGVGIGATDERGKLVIPDVIRNNSCLTDDEICEYLNHRAGKAWHISDLKIYDKPKELGEFVKPCDWNFDCCTCKRAVYELTQAEAKVFYGCDREITRPPQSWQYVEEV